MYSRHNFDHISCFLGGQPRHKIYHTPLKLLVTYSINADSTCLCDIAYHKSGFISLSDLPMQPRDIQLATYHLNIYIAIQLATILTSVSPYN